MAGFDTHPDSFLKVATARLKLGPIWTPPITPVVLRHRGQEFILTNLSQAVRARGAFRYFSWEFRTETRFVEIAGTISAPREAFVGLAYQNPPGGVKQRLNTKIAACLLRFKDKKSGVEDRLETRHRAAFEILTDDRGHGVPMLV